MLESLQGLPGQASSALLYLSYQAPGLDVIALPKMALPWMPEIALPVDGRMMEAALPKLPHSQLKAAVLTMSVRTRCKRRSLGARSAVVS